MHNTKPQHRLQLLLAFMCIAFFGSTAQTQAGEAGLFNTTDKKDLPATGCVQTKGPDRLYYDDDGSIVNRDTQKSIQVNCPLIRDHTSNKLDVVNIHIEKDNFDWCRIRVIQPTTGGSGYETRKNAKPAGKYDYRGGAYYQFYPLGDYPNGSVYMANCSLRPGTRLIGFSYEEDR